MQFGLKPTRPRRDQVRNKRPDCDKGHQSLNKRTGTRLASPLGHVARISTFGIKPFMTALNGETCMMKGVLRTVPYVFLSTLLCEKA